MHHLPRLLCVPQRSTGATRRIGVRDLTLDFLRLVCPHGYLEPDIDLSRLEARDLRPVSGSLTEAGMEGLEFPDFHEELATFIREVGGIEMLPGLHERLGTVSAMRDRLERARKTLEDVLAATLLPFDTKLDLFYAPGSEQTEFVPAPQDAYAKLEWANYIKSHPRPVELDTREHSDWMSGMWRYPKIGPLHVFATVRKDWQGPTVERLRTALREVKVAGLAGQVTYAEYALGKDFPFDINAILLETLVDHPGHDVDSFSGMDFLIGTLGRWIPHLDTGSDAEKASHTALGEWNSLQDIVTHVPDRTRIVTIYGHSKEEIVERCEKDVLATAEALEALQWWDPETAMSLRA